MTALGQWIDALPRDVDALVAWVTLAVVAGLLAQAVIRAARRSTR